MLAEAAYYARMIAGLAEYQLLPRQKDFLASIRDQMEHREERFLMQARHVLNQPDNLYRKLFDAAGCSYADLEAAVSQKGLRAALESLVDAGVLIRHAEFRGKEPIVRGGREIAWSPKDWNSPWGRGLIEHSTSGSTGKRFTTSLGRRVLLHREGYEFLNARHFDLFSRPRVLVSSVLPSAWPLRYVLVWNRVGMPLDDWFFLGIEKSRAWHYTTVSQWLVTQFRLLGAKTPRTGFLPMNDFTPVARCLARYRQQGRPAFIRATASPATRIAAAARDQSLDISGTLFAVSGEPLSDAKRAVIEGAGAEVFPQYHSAEFGTIGFSCRHMNSGNCVHLFQDSLLLVPRRQGGAGYNTLYVTNLLPWSPRILINVEADDSAMIEKTTCDCEYTRMGFDLQARDIFSYGKVTGQGITLEAADMLELLEQALPAQFGGAPGDYQLAEVEGPSQTEMVLRVSPRTGATELGPIREFFLTALARLYGGHLTVRMWSFTGGFRVVLEEPELTYTGKAHPLRLRGAATRTASSDGVVP